MESCDGLSPERRAHILDASTKSCGRGTHHRATDPAGRQFIEADRSPYLVARPVNAVRALLTRGGRWTTSESSEARIASPARAERVAET